MRKYYLFIIRNDFCEVYKNNVKTLYITLENIYKLENSDCKILLTFEKLMNSIKEINSKAGSMAKRAVNQLMTLRNWAIGYYIVEYEQGGKDKADYGTNLLKKLEKQISEKGLNETLFRVCRQFYLTYPQIHSTVSNEFKILL